MPRTYTPRVPCKCEACGSDFTMPPAEHRRSGGRFCSWACRYSATPEERFWIYVDKESTEHAGWVWTGGKDQDGYGIFSIGKSSPKAHRFAWLLATGKDADGPVLHTCDFPACVRNDDTGVYVLDGIEYERHGHLWLGTNAANTRDMVVKERQSAGDRHIFRRHPELHARGVQTNRAKLTDDQVRAIRAEQWGTQVEWAEKYMVSQSTISYIRSGKGWRHVT